MDLRFRLLNVFAIDGDPFSGNPLAVVTDADRLDAKTMQRLARQFNLSESTFVTDPGSGPHDASVRIFTPDYEMPFAGHPTLGTASVVSDLHGGVDAVLLSMPAGRIPVVRQGRVWTLTANEPVVRACAVPVEVEGAEVLRLHPRHAGDRGARDSTRRQSADLRLDPHRVRHDRGAAVLHPRGRGRGGPCDRVGCVNLGGWLRHLGDRGRRYAVSQGAAVGRPSRLTLAIDEAGAVQVGGLVREIGEGRLHLEL